MPCIPLCQTAIIPAKYAPYAPYGVPARRMQIKQRKEGKKMENQGNGTKTRMEIVCDMLGLRMHQLFTVSNKDSTHSAPGGLYFFTDYGIRNESGVPAQGMLDNLVAGRMDAKPLKEYRYQHADTVDVESLLGQEIKTEVASLEDGQRSKALYAVAAIGKQGISWRVEVSEEGMCMRRRRTEFTDFAQAVKFYNRRKLV